MRVSDQVSYPTTKLETIPSGQALLETIPLEARNDSERNLQDGVDISENTIKKVQNFVEDFRLGKDLKGVKIYKFWKDRCIFSFDDMPEVIFKVNTRNPTTNSSMKERYLRMIYARNVCDTHKLGLLVIPNAKLFSVEHEEKQYEILAEKTLDFNSHEGIQQDFFEKDNPNLDEAIKELATFICKTGYSDVSWRNNPFLNPLDGVKQRIGLIDLEEMESKEIGLFGEKRRRGLVGCVSKRHGEMVKEIALENQVPVDSFLEVYERRKEEIENNNKIIDLYLKNGTKPRDILNVDIPSLRFDDLGYNAELTDNLKKCAKTLIKFININLLENNDHDHIRTSRKIEIHLLGIANRMYRPQGSPLDEECYDNFSYLGKLSPKFPDMSESHRWLVLSEPQYCGNSYPNESYLGIVINRLIENGHIYEQTIIRNEHRFLQV